MDDLISWAAATNDRHFIVHRGVGIETRWRVVAWLKAEGECIVGSPGEGYGKTCDEAASSALLHLQAGFVMERPTGASWYIPNNLARMLAEK